MNDIQVISKCKNETTVELVDLIGVENTVAVVKHFSRTQVYIPQMKNISKEYRNQNIYKDFLSGMSYIKLNNKYGFNKISLKRIIKSETEKRKAVKNERK